MQLQGGSQAEGYKVQLEIFEGPLDLLLHLIRQQEIDIYDIPIAHITRQYLEYLEILDVFNLDNAGEFLVMAATLMRIKARMLLPVQREGDEDDVDPREELVRRLLEYKRFKEAATKLGEAADRRSDLFPRGQEYAFLDAEEEPAEFSLSLFDLLGAVRNVLDRLEGDHLHHVFQEVYTVENQMAAMLERLETRERIRFEDVFSEARVKMEVVVTFIAVLELMKEGRLRARQLEPYGQIWLSQCAEEPDSHEPRRRRAEEGEDAA